MKFFRLHITRYCVCVCVGGGGGSRLEIKCSVEDRNATEPKVLYLLALGQLKGTVCEGVGGGGAEQTGDQM